MLYITYETPNIDQAFSERKLAKCCFGFEKLEVKLYRNQLNSVSDLQLSSWVMISIVFIVNYLMNINEFYKVGAQVAQAGR